MSNVYDSGKIGIANGSILWPTHDLRALLVRPSYVFNLAHGFVADITGELTDASYARKVLAGRSIQLAGNNVDYVASNPTWLALAGNEPIGAAVVYKHVSKDADSPLVAYVNLAAHTSDGSDFTPRWNNASPSGAVFRLRSPSSANPGGLIQLHDLTHNPVGLWQLQEGLTDSSGNGFDLSLVIGDQRFTEMLPGVAALNLFSTNKYRHNVPGTALRILGDITIEMFVRLRGLASGAILSYDTAAEAEADNFLYAIGLTAVPTQTQFASEHGAGIDDTHDLPLLPALYQPMHLALRRQANVAQFFLNGKPWGPASAALPAPTGGTNSVFYLGWAANPSVECDLSSIKIVPSALTDLQVLAEYNRTLGPHYGIRV